MLRVPRLLARNEVREAHVEPGLACAPIFEPDRAQLGLVLTAFEVVNSDDVAVGGALQKKAGHGGVRCREKERVAGPERLKSAEAVQPGSPEFARGQSSGENPAEHVDVDKGSIKKKPHF